jgi:hypothetical protein
MLWKTRRPVQQDIRGITCLPNPSLTADYLLSSDHQSRGGAPALYFPSRFHSYALSIIKHSIKTDEDLYGDLLRLFCFVSVTH